MFSENSIIKLKDGLKKLDIDFNENQIEIIKTFFEIYSLWNKKINISSINNEDEFIIKHILDSISGIKFINDKNIADLGSGGGFPGIVIKIFKPEIQISLIENKSKKVLYLKELIKNLKLDVRVYNPSENKIPGDFDIVVTRAFGDLTKIHRIAKMYTKNRIIAYKGKYEKILNEIKELKSISSDNIEIKKVTIPFTDFERHIVILNLKKKTNQ